MLERLIKSVVLGYNIIRELSLVAGECEHRCRRTSADAVALSRIDLFVLLDQLHSTTEPGFPTQCEQPSGNGADSTISHCYLIELNDTLT